MEFEVVLAMAPRVDAPAPFTPPEEPDQTGEILARQVMDLYEERDGEEAEESAEDSVQSSSQNESPEVALMLAGFGIELSIDFSDSDDRFGAMSPAFRNEVLLAGVDSDKQVSSQARDILADVSSAPPVYSSSDPILLAVQSALRGHPELRGTMATAAIHGYQQQSDDQILSQLAELANNDPAFAGAVRHYIGESLDSEDALTRFKGVELLLATSSQWNYSDFVTAVDSIGPDQIDDFRQALNAAPPELLSHYQTRLITGELSELEGSREFQARMELLVPGLAPRLKDESLLLFTPEDDQETGPFESGDSWRTHNRDLHAEAFRPESSPSADDFYDQHRDRYLDATMPGSMDEGPKTTISTTELFRSWGVEMDATAAEQAAQRYGADTLLDLDRRIAMYNALSPDLRAALTGHRDTVNVREVADVILGGRLGEEGTTAAFLTGSPPIEQVVAQKMEEIRAQYLDRDYVATQHEDGMVAGMREILDVTATGYSAADMAEDAVDKSGELAISASLLVTPGGPSLLSDNRVTIDDIAQSGVEEWTALQNQLVEQYKDDRAIGGTTRRLADADAVQIAELELAQRLFAYQELTQAGGSPERQDYMALALVDRYGAATLAQSGASVIQDLENGGLQRLREAGLIQSDQLPQYTGDQEQRFEQALQALTQLQRGEGGNLDLPLHRAAALEQIDHDPTYQRTLEIGADIGGDLALLTTLFQPGKEGTKGPKFVDLVQNAARLLERDMQVNPQQIEDMKELSATLRATADAAQDAETQAQLQTRIAMIDGILSVVDPASPGNAALKEMISIARSREYNEDDLANWLTENGPAIAGAVAGATIATIATGGAAPAIWLLAGAAGAVGGKEGAEEAFYLFNHTLFDTGLGHLRERSYVGAWGARHHDDFADLSSGDSEMMAEAANELMVSFFHEVERPFVTEVAKNALWMGVGMGFARFGRALSAEISGAESAAAGSVQSAQLPSVAAAAPKVVAPTAGQQAARVGHEFLEELMEEGVEEFLSRLDVNSPLIVAMAQAIGGARSGGGAADVAIPTADVATSATDTSMANTTARVTELHRLAADLDTDVVTDVASVGDPSMSASAEAVRANAEINRILGPIRERLDSGENVSEVELNAAKDLVHKELAPFLEATARRLGIPPVSLDRLHIDPHTRHRGFFSLTTGDITLNLHNNNMLTTLDHELQHRADRLNEAAFERADSVGYREALVTSSLADVGNGQRRMTRDDRTENRRRIEDPEALKELRALVRASLDSPADEMKESVFRASAHLHDQFGGDSLALMKEVELEIDHIHSLIEAYIPEEGFDSAELDSAVLGSAVLGSAALDSAAQHYIDDRVAAINRAYLIDTSLAQIGNGGRRYSDDGLENRPELDDPKVLNELRALVRLSLNPRVDGPVSTPVYSERLLAAFGGDADAVAAEIAKERDSIHHILSRPTWGGSPILEGALATNPALVHLLQGAGGNLVSVHVGNELDYHRELRGVYRMAHSEIAARKLQASSELQRMFEQFVAEQNPQTAEEKAEAKIVAAQRLSQDANGARLLEHLRIATLQQQILIASARGSSEQAKAYARELLEPMSSMDFQYSHDIQFMLDQGLVTRAEFNRARDGSDQSGPEAGGKHAFLIAADESSFDAGREIPRLEERLTELQGGGTFSRWSHHSEIKQLQEQISKIQAEVETLSGLASHGRKGIISRLKPGEVAIIGVDGDVPVASVFGISEGHARLVRMADGSYQFTDGNGGRPSAAGRGPDGADLADYGTFVRRIDGAGNVFYETVSATQPTILRSGDEVYIGHHPESDTGFRSLRIEIP